MSECLLCGMPTDPDLGEKVRHYSVERCISELGEAVKKLQKPQPIPTAKEGQ